MGLVTKYENKTLCFGKSLYPAVHQSCVLTRHGTECIMFLELKIN